MNNEETEAIGYSNTISIVSGLRASLFLSRFDRAILEKEAFHKRAAE